MQIYSGHPDRVPLTLCLEKLENTKGPRRSYFCANPKSEESKDARQDNCGLLTCVGPEDAQEVAPQDLPDLLLRVLPLQQPTDQLLVDPDVVLSSHVDIGANA